MYFIKKLNIIKCPKYNTTIMHFPDCSSVSKLLVSLRTNLNNNLAACF